MVHGLWAHVGHSCLREVGFSRVFIPPLKNTWHGNGSGDSKPGGCMWSVVWEGCYWTQTSALLLSRELSCNFSWIRVFVIILSDFLLPARQHLQQHCRNCLLSLMPVRKHTIASGAHWHSYSPLALKRNFYLPIKTCWQISSWLINSGKREQVSRTWLLIQWDWH